MKKLNKHIKVFIKRSIHETGINDLKYFVEQYGMQVMNRALKVIEFLRLKRKMIIKVLYSNCTRVYTNYYKHDKNHFLKYGYIFKGGFWTQYKLDVLH